MKRLMCDDVFYSSVFFSSSTFFYSWPNCRIPQFLKSPAVFLSLSFSLTHSLSLPLSPSSFFSSLPFSSTVNVAAKGVDADLQSAALQVSNAVSLPSSLASQHLLLGTYSLLMNNATLLNVIHFHKE